MPNFKWMVLILGLAICVSTPPSLTAQTRLNCATSNSSFSTGEQIGYIVSYSWFFIWTDVGEVNFEVKRDLKFGRNFHHLHATGKSFQFYDWFFKVRDLYESWVDPETLKPVYYNRDIYEGGFTKQNEYWFDWSLNRLAIRTKRRDNPNRYDTLIVKSCLYDVVSAVYTARNFDFNNLVYGKVFPIDVVLDQEVFRVNYRFLGSEAKHVRDFGTFSCLKFQVDLVAGDIFSGNQKLIVWVTDDRNRVPVLIESPIRVGSVKARVVAWRGLRHPATAKLK